MRIYRILPLLLAVSLLTACGQPAAQSGGVSSQSSSSQDSASSPSSSLEENPFVDAAEIEEVDLEDEAVALSESPAALPGFLEAVASGTLVKENSKAVIDYSNTKDGYVMVRFTAATDKRLKAQVKGPTTTYTYNLTQGKWETFPLSDGNGSYTVTVYENIEGTKYSSVLSLTCDVALTDEFAPFLRPNQYVDYASAPNTVAKAADLTQGITDPLKKVEAVYNFVVQNLTYDKQLAATVQSGYLPVLDTVLAKKTGICFE